MLLPTQLIFPQIQFEFAQLYRTYGYTMQHRTWPGAVQTEQTRHIQSKLKINCYTRSGLFRRTSARAMQRKSFVDDVSVISNFRLILNYLREFRTDFILSDGKILDVKDLRRGKGRASPLTRRPRRYSGSKYWCSNLKLDGRIQSLSHYQTLSGILYTFRRETIVSSASWNLYLQLFTVWERKREETRYFG